MAHYAFLDENNVVVKIITGIDEDVTDNLPSEFSSWEEFYADQQGKTCKRCSYNTVMNTHKDGKTPFRGTYPGKGYIYDATDDKFYPPAPFPSWTLNKETYQYEPPIADPINTLSEDEIYAGKTYNWNESAYQADNSTGWELYTP
jgi:ribosomal protein S27AE